MLLAERFGDAVIIIDKINDDVGRTNAIIWIIIHTPANQSVIHRYITSIKISIITERFGDAVITLSAKDDILREQDSEDKVWERAEIDLKEALSYLKDYEVPTGASGTEIILEIRVQFQRSGGREHLGCIHTGISNHSTESYEGRNSGNTWVEPSLATLYNEPDDQRAQLIVPLFLPS